MKGEDLNFNGDQVKASGYQGLPASPSGKVPLMIGGGAPRVLGIAGREADIVSINYNNSSGHLAGSRETDTAEATLKKIEWIKEGAGNRFNDIENHGSGAPLVPYLDWILFKNYNKNVISINIGGISNLSLVCGPNKNKILGFDIGPGMCLIDRYVQEYWGELFDKDGTLSSKGLINQRLLNELLKDKYINKTPPKSLTTENYGIEYLDKLKEAYPLINKYDFLRTLVNFTVCSIKKNINTFINVQYLKNVKMIISGGGAKNKVLYNDIKSFK